MRVDGNVLGPQSQTNPVIVVYRDGRAYLEDNGKQTPMQAQQSLPLPSLDWLDYLAAAEDVTLVPPTNVERELQLVHYRYTLNMHKLAEHLTAQTSAKGAEALSIKHLTGNKG